MSAFTTVRTVGPMLPADILARVVDSKDLPGLTPADYHLVGGETLRSAASRAWVRLASAWANFSTALDRVPDGDPATRLTREKWLHVLFTELGYGRLPAVPAPGLSVGDEVLPVSHAWGAIPVHMVGAGVGLDTRAVARAGKRAMSPHALVQEYLSRSDGALWGFVTNGLSLRVLRDSTSLVRAAYVEFDLQAMFDGEAFADFVLLYLLCHVSRVDADKTIDCWLERWRQEAVVSGTRALNALRDGVEQALRTLGTGFLRPGLNPRLQTAMASGEITTGRYYQLLLRLVYQMLFLCVAEDRDMLIPPGASPEAVGRYRDFFSTRRLRRLARRRLGTRHTDLWPSLLVVLDGLGADGGRPELALPALGGLFAPGTLGLLADAWLTNADLLAAVRSLSLLPDVSGTPRAVDYRNLGAEELGSVYESLLEYAPAYDASTGAFELRQLAGNERKTTGSYYTPTSLIDSLLDSALEPLLDEAMDADDPERALLDVTVCDPACGSGHFLVAAARRIARRLAYTRTGEVEPAPEPVWHAMRDVVGRCIYGVDVNDLAAELAKVSLWLEALDPGYPLSFLDPHIKVGNSLLGATPALLANGLPDDAFKPLGGDDRAVARVLTKRNKAERSQAGQLDLPFLEQLSNEDLGCRAQAVTAIDDTTVDGVRRRAQTWRELDTSPELDRARLLADAWCAAFMWRMRPGEAPAVTTRLVARLAQGLDLPATTVAEIRGIAAEHRFFHWHLEFPEIFHVPSHPLAAESPQGWTGGFTCVLGNPPWERIKLQEQEFFAARDPDIAQAPNAATRRRMIAALARTRPELHEEFEEAKRRAEGESLFLRASGRYPLNGRGDINTYAVFAEATRNLIDPQGRMGIILPTGIATDATTQHYFRDLVRASALVSLYDFENRKPLFEGVHRSFKFCLLTAAGAGRRESAADFAFFRHDPLELREPDVRFALKPDEIELLNPNTGTCPIFRSRRDAEITLGIYRRVPVLIREGDPNGNPWGVSFLRMFDMANDSGLFHTRDQLENDGWRLHGNVFIRDRQRMLPLYEAKMLHHYDHRWASYDDSVESVEGNNPHQVALPRYWLSEEHVRNRLAGRWDNGWLLGWRDITNTTNERTAVSTVFPRAAVNDKFLLAFPAHDPWLLQACWSSLAFDYAARQKLGGTSMKYFTFMQLPVPPPQAFACKAPWQPRVWLDRWIADRVLELSCTAWDMRSYAQNLGDNGPPFRWDAERRAQLRAELDAAFFHIYGLDRDEVDHVLDSFPVLRKNEVKQFGEFRTKRLVTEIYEAMAEAARTDVPYRSLLTPPPGQGPQHPDIRSLRQPGPGDRERTGGGAKPWGASPIRGSQDV